MIRLLPPIKIKVVSKEGSTPNPGSMELKTPTAKEQKKKRKPSLNPSTQMAMVQMPISSKCFKGKSSTPVPTSLSKTLLN